MNAFQRLQNAYFMWRVENEVPDSECVIIRVTHEFRMDVLSNDVRGAYYLEEGGRNPKERLFGCPFESVRAGSIDGDFEFFRPDWIAEGFTPSFLINPHDGGPE